jgi:hypothetical protein
MPEAASYAAIEVLRDGTRVDIRALRPDDRAAILAAVDHTSERSLYRRFFAARRSFSEREIAFFLNVDLISHVALVAVVRHDDGGEEIAGGGRYIVLQPGRAEAAFTVVDQFQGRVSAPCCCAIWPRSPVTRAFTSSSLRSCRTTRRCWRCSSTAACP